MEYFCFSVFPEIKKLLDCFNSSQLSGGSELMLSLNNDSLPIFKSRKKSWPVLSVVSNIEHVTVFPVALLLGDLSPTHLTFLTDTACD